MIKLIIMSVFSLFIFSCDDDNPVVPEDVYGCTEPSSCSYDPNVNVYVPSSCLELDECGECGGDNSICLGCDDVLNSGLVNDECGLCGGDNSTCTDDCGIINGDNQNIMDECGNCEGQELVYVYLWDECYNIETTSEINFSFYNLTGGIPSDIGKLRNLSYLELGSTDLTGEIPFEIGNLTNLTYLNLSSNQITGEIPEEIGNLMNLTYLNLSSNLITGEIPEEIGSLMNLTYLGLSGNLLTGEIHEEICNQGDSTPSVGNNKLCPPYPFCISQSDIDSQDTSNCP